MLNLKGEKMAKSTGHVVTLLDSLEEWDPMAVRLFYLRTHYRKPLDFSPEALEDAEASLARMRAFRRRAPSGVEDAADPGVLDRFKDSMDDDLDVAGALAVVFDTDASPQTRRSIEVRRRRFARRSLRRDDLGVLGIDHRVDRRRRGGRFGRSAEQIRCRRRSRRRQRSSQLSVERARANRDWATCR